MATKLLYRCCDVAAFGETSTPCWNCQAIGKAIKVSELPDYHPVPRFFKRTTTQGPGTIDRL